MEEMFESLRKYNLWGEGELDFGCPRPQYAEKIRPYVGNRLVKVLEGQRRAGKSFLLRQIARGLVESGVDPRNTFLVNMELEAFDSLKSHLDLENLFKTYQAQINPQGKIYVFLDEVQEIAGWEKFVNSHSQDYAGDYELFITGSNAKMLSGELSTLLSGRYVKFEVFPLSFDEYVAFRSLERNRASYLSYLHDGGMPVLTGLEGEEVKRNYVSSLRDTILLKDIIQRYDIKNPRLLEDLFAFLVNNASKLISISNIAAWFQQSGMKTTYDTVALYISYMQEAFLVHKAERFNISGREMVAGNCKFYINDPSFHNYLYRGFGYGAGYLLENLVYLDLRRAGYDVYVGTLRNKEVDFVAMKGDAKRYLQVSYSLHSDDPERQPETLMREYAPLEAIRDHYPKVVVSADEHPLGSKGGIQHIQAWNIHEIL